MAAKHARHPMREDKNFKGTDPSEITAQYLYCGLVGKIKCFVHITRYFLVFYLLATIVMYIHMYNLARKHRKSLAKKAYAVTGQVQAKFHEFKGLRLLFMIAGSFVVFWSPLTVITFMTDVRRNPVFFYRAYVLTTPLYVVNSVVDPVVYYNRSHGFRRAFKILVRRFKNAVCGECYQLNEKRLFVVNVRNV